LVLFADPKQCMSMRLPKTPFVFVLLMALFSVTTKAQSPGPREFLNTPVHQATAWVDYVGATSETIDANLPLPNNVSVSQVIAPSLLLNFPIDNKYAGFSVTVPYSKIVVSGPNGNLEKWGFNDPAFAFHKNIFGLPAYRRDRFSEAVPQTLMSFHFTVNPPIGSYDRNSPVNTGAHRWAFSPLVNLDIPFNKGVGWLDLYAWARFYTNNHEFQGNSLLAQHPTGTAAAWYSHNLGPKTWLAIGGFYDYGGETYINHVSQHDTANGFRPSVGISRKFGRFGVSFRYENTASKPKASPSSGLLLLRISMGSMFQF
jgi:Putative MetA-pathway of phenol degradation